MVHRSIFLTFLFVLVFSLFPLGRRSWADDINAYFFLDLFLILLSVGVEAYLLYDIDAWQLRWYNPTPADTAVGTIAILLVLEASRRTVGWAMVGVTAFFVIHTVFSRYFPGVLNAPPTPWAQLVDVLFSDHGIFSAPIEVMASFILLFLTFSALLIRSGAGAFFINLAYSITGRMAGGPAKTAVVSSALFGTLSGSAVANVVTTGSFTIPLMKSVGYSAVTAGAVEAVASTGGNFMPPVMGAVAFIMAQYLGIPYIDVCFYALIPALLYYAAIMMMVHFEAKRLGLLPLTKEALPSFWHTLLRGGHLLLAVIALTVFLVFGYTSMMAAVWGILVLFLLSFVRQETRLTPVAFLSAFEEASRASLTVGTACACAGIIMGSLYSSGLGMKITNIIVKAAGGRLWLTLIYVMLLSLLLGMGMPSTGVYLTLVTVVIPALIEMGVLPIAAHMFCFYYGVISCITPPVCVASFAGAAIAEAPPMRTGIEATKLGIASYIIPFMFVYNPTMLMIGPVTEILWATFTGLWGTVFLAAGTVGRLYRKACFPERVVMIVAAICLIKPGLVTDAIGFLLMGVIVYVQKAFDYPEAIDERVWEAVSLGWVRDPRRKG
jgi:TRAP transporter 4TM/12TM fusion protein